MGWGWEGGGGERAGFRLICACIVITYLYIIICNDNNNNNNDIHTTYTTLMNQRWWKLLQSGKGRGVQCTTCQFNLIMTILFCKEKLKKIVKLIYKL